MLAITDLVLFQCWITLSSDPHSSIRVRVDLVLNELTIALYTDTEGIPKYTEDIQEYTKLSITHFLMDVYPTGLAMVDGVLVEHRISFVLNLNSSNPVS